MRSAWITNLALVALVTALAVYAIYKPGAEADKPRFELSTLSKSTVDRIRIESKGGALIELRKQGDEWQLIQPLAARADRSQIDRLLDLLAARSKEKLAANDLQRFDLDHPALKVTFNDQTIAFGTTNPLSQEQYVLAGESVYLLGSYYRSLVPDSPQRVLTHALFKLSEKPVAFALPNFTVQQRDGKWELMPPSRDMSDKDRPSQDDFNRWVDEWKLASSLLTQPAGSRSPSEWINVRLADGSSIRLGVVQREPELVLLRTDEKLSFYFSQQMRDRLLSAPLTAHAADANGKPAPSESNR
ncbi:MAG TPA: DUF4340 domain-containing protein [Burkholderiales bacterium]|nr:DUF4340 domain-containing protein [Burkholderiales bacterium]